MITTTSHQDGKYIVNLARREGVPYAFEIYTDKTTNDTGYHAEGCLEIDLNMVTGYDGVYELPMSVAKILKAEGYEFDGYVYPDEEAIEIRPSQSKDCTGY